MNLDKKAQFILVISCVFPDFDSISFIGGMDAWFQFHRGPLHSFSAIILASAAITIIYYLVVRPPSKKVFSIAVICLGGMFSHIALDLITPWKIAVFWPFSGEKIAYSLTYFFDIVFLAVLFLASVLIINFGTKKKARAIMVTALLLVLINFGVRYYERHAALNTIDEYTGEIVPMPTFRPDTWWVFIKTPTETGYTYSIYHINSFSGEILSSQTVDSPYITYAGPDEPPLNSPEQAVAYSKKDKTVNTFIEGCYFPAVTVNFSQGVWELLWYDTYTTVSGSLSGGMSITINPDGTVLEVKRISRMI